jgi:hypothetical protein
MLPNVALVQPDAGDPTEHHPSVLRRRYRAISTATVAEEEFAQALLAAAV